MTTPESPFQTTPEENDNWRKQIFDDVSARYHRVTTDNPEGGFAVAARVWVVGAMFVGLAVGTSAAFGQHMDYVGIQASADLGKARTTSEASLLKYDDAHQQLDVATAYFSEKFTATGIPYIVDTKPIDVIPDSEVNEQLDGEAANKFEIPLSALKWSINPQTGKHDVVVDGSQAKVLAYWPGAGPDIKPFTVNKGGKAQNFEDPMGERNALTRGLGAALAIFNSNQLANTFDNLDDKIAHDMKVKALQSLTEACVPKLESRNIAAIGKAITNILSPNDRNKLGQISINNLKWTIDDGPALHLKGNTYPSNINKFEIKDFKVDEVNCDAAAPAGNN